MEIKLTRVADSFRTLAQRISRLEQTIRGEDREFEAVVEAARQDIDHINRYITDLALIRKKRHANNP